jgi:hypothetical protein
VLPPILRPLYDPGAAIPMGNDHTTTLAAIGLLGHLMTRCGGHATKQCIRFERARGVGGVR